MDALEVAAAAGSYFGLKDLVPKLLGPTADYLGGELKGLTEKGVKNVQRVFRAAEKRLGNQIDQPGQVHPRVVKNILAEAYFCDGPVAAEYFGGILASSRCIDQRDDRGAYFAALVGRLSSYQIRSHYVLYQCFKHVFNGRRLPITRAELRDKASVFVPLTNYVHAMDCEPYEGLTPYLEHATVGLINESLLSDYFIEGTVRELGEGTLPNHEKVVGLVAAPTRLGLELFLWSHGYGHQPVHQVFFQDNVFPMISTVHLSFDGVVRGRNTTEWGPEEG